METLAHDGITIHDAQGFAGMRRAGRLAAEVLDRLSPHVVEGVTTAELDRMALELIEEAGARSATIFYRGYSHALCTSLNHVICHGLPSDKPLREGDILNIDVTLVFEGWHGDTSRMFAIGQPPLKARRLIDVTFECLELGIAAVRPGGRLGDVGHAIQRHAEAHRMSVVRDFCGHGLGRRFHMPPNVVHYGRPGTGTELRPGMFFTIEPMINLGRPDVRMLSDGWTAVTRDRSLSAQFEHAVGVTDDGVEVFTRSPAGLDRPRWT